MGRQGEAQWVQEAGRPAETGNSHFLMVMARLVRSPETFSFATVLRKVAYGPKKSFGSTFVVRKVWFGLRKVN